MSTKRIAALLLGLALLAAAPASASQITTYVYEQQGCDCEDYHHVYGASGPLSSSLNIITGGTTPVGVLTIQGTAAATAWYGGVKVTEAQFGNSTTVGLPAGIYFDTLTSTASFDDVFRFLGPAGQSGVADVAIRMSGSGSADVFPLTGAIIDLSQSAYVRISLSGAGVNNAAHYLELVPLDYHGGIGSFSLLGTGHITLPFIFGQDITIAMVASCSSSTRFRGGNGDTAAACDLGHTVQWDGLTSIVDSSGNALNPIVTSDSGANYRNAIADPNAVAAVPEPGTLVLLGTGLAAAAYRIRRVRQARCQ